MAWFSGVIQDVRQRGSGLRERVREHTKALRVSNGVGVGSEKSANGFLPAEEAERRIEHEAARLRECAAASEVLERWLVLLRTAPRRYTDAGQALSFKQVFLRSHGLEFALDASARSPELRRALRSYALAAPARWPESCPPPMAFARAFVALLWATVGPTELWLQPLATLLSWEQVPKGAQGTVGLAAAGCHTWLVQLLVARRLYWQASDVADRETDLLAMEESTLKAMEIDEGHPGDLPSELRALSKLSSDASATAETLLERRCVLAEDLKKAMVAEQEKGDAVPRHHLLRGLRRKELGQLRHLRQCQRRWPQRAPGAAQQSGGRSEGRLLTQLPDEAQLSQEIAAAEEVQRELLKQLEQNKEHLDGLRRAREERRKEEERLTAALNCTEQKMVSQLAEEDTARQQSEATQRLAFAVADVAKQLQEPESDRTAEAKLSSVEVRNRAAEQSLALKLATHEVKRLRKAEEVGKKASNLAQEKLAHAEVDQAEARQLWQVLRRSCQELRACRSEKLLSALEEQGEEGEAGQLASEIRSHLQGCQQLLASLEAAMQALDNLDVEKENWEVVEEPPAEAFLFAADERDAPSWDAGVKSLFQGLFPRGGTPSGAETSADDPFLLEGIEARGRPRAREVVVETTVGQRGYGSTTASFEDLERLKAGERIPGGAGVDAHRVEPSQAQTVAEEGADRVDSKPSQQVQTAAEQGDRVDSEPTQQVQTAAEEGADRVDSKPSQQVQTAEQGDRVDSEPTQQVQTAAEEGADRVDSEPSQQVQTAAEEGAWLSFSCAVKEPRIAQESCARSSTSHACAQAAKPTGADSSRGRCRSSSQTSADLW
ncbi:unnamed protein product [Effrenium voratum]|nr:unnamed protein product [Effrenium voratum]